MKYILGLTLMLVAIGAIADSKYLYYKYNDNVMVIISNVPCPIEQYKEAFPWAAIARRVDGQSLFGCFNKDDEDHVKIQWNKGDVSVFPANVFLIDPNKGTEAPPKATL